MNPRIANPDLETNPYERDRLLQVRSVCVNAVDFWPSCNAGQQVQAQLVLPVLVDLTSATGASGHYLSHKSAGTAGKNSHHVQPLRTSSPQLQKVAAQMHLIMGSAMTELRNETQCVHPPQWAIQNSC